MKTTLKEKITKFIVICFVASFLALAVYGFVINIVLK